MRRSRRHTQSLIWLFRFHLRQQLGLTSFKFNAMPIQTLQLPVVSVCEVYLNSAIPITSRPLSQSRTVFLAPSSFWQTCIEIMNHEAHQTNTVTFHKELAGDQTSPPYISTFRDFLLNFDDKIADQSWLDDGSKKAGPLSKNEFWTDNIELEHSRVKLTGLKLCEKLRDWASSLESDASAKGDEWRLYYITNFVIELEEATRARQDSRMHVSPFSNYLRYILTHVKVLESKLGPLSG
jgi:hypothetical protein